MPRTVAEKLQIKPRSELLVSPGTAENLDLLAPLPDNVTVVEGIDRDTDGVAVVFAGSRAELDSLLAGEISHLTAPRATWICYPKGNRADINRDSIHERVGDFGWTLNANIAISEVWSAVRMKRQPQ